MSTTVTTPSSSTTTVDFKSNPSSGYWSIQEKLRKSMKMPKALKEKWINALMSGKYKQGKGALKDTLGGFCCLGVLQMECSGDVEMYSDNAARAYPSTDWMVSHNVDPMTFPVQVFGGLNDVERKSFAEIAKFINDNVEGV